MDFKKALEKLNSLDAKDLKNLDLSKLKNYNLSRFKDDLASKPNLLINAGIIIATVLCVIAAASNYTAVSKTVRVKEVEVTSRLDMIREKVAAELKFKNYLSTYPNAIPTNQLIGKISEFAEEAQVNIISFSPVKVNETEFITQYSINLDIEGKTYQNIVDFMHIIETSPYTLRINKWSGRGASVAGPGTEVPLNVYMEIGSIQLNDV